MNKKDLELTQVVQLNKGLPLVSVVGFTENEVIVRHFNGKRSHVSAGSLKNPRIVIHIPLTIKIVADETDYHVSSPDIEGLHTSGFTINECLRNAQAVGGGFIRSFIRHWNEEQHG